MTKLNKEVGKVQHLPSIPFPQVKIEGDYLYMLTKSDDGTDYWKREGRKIIINNKNRFLEDNNMNLNLDIWTKDGPITIENIKRSILVSKEEILETVKVGSDVNGGNYKAYMMSLINQEEILNTEFRHSEIGWSIHNGEPIYKHKEIISKTGLKSQYQGDTLIETKGSLAEYKDFLKEEVIGNIPLEAAIAIGLSGVVLGYLPNYNSNVCHLYGNSTTGKTTAGDLIISLVSRPNLDENSLKFNWNATSNSIIGKLRKKYGVVILIDDSSVSKIKDPSNLIYRLESGRDKERLTKESELKEAETWKVAIVSTGESSLLENSNQNEGLKVRLSEFADVQWTKDSDHSDRIKNRVQEVYGHGVLVVAEVLLRMKKEDILELLAYYEKTGLAHLQGINKVNHLTSRKLKSYSTMRLAIQLFEQEIKLGFNMKKIEGFLLHHMFTDQRAMWEIAFEKILEYVENNINKFNQEILFDSTKKITLEYPAKSYSDLQGKISDKEIIEKKDEKTGKTQKTVQREISILENEFYKILKDMQFTNPKGILKDFKKNNVIDFESDRNTRTRKVSEKGNPVKVVVLKLEVKYEETNDMQEKYQRLMKLERQLEEGKSEERIIESKERREEAEKTKKKAVKTKPGHKEITKNTKVIVKGGESIESILRIDPDWNKPITIDDLGLDE